MVNNVLSSSGWVPGVCLQDCVIHSRVVIGKAAILVHAQLLGLLRAHLFLNMKSY